ncbi:MAG: hypothetical protein KBE09_04185 [Candidatus Pacebacteria bacterium]|nr:hypothetical protein [Candidatus Paceibacterota bacterium]
MIRAFIVGVAIACIFFAPAWVPLLMVGLLALRFAAWEAVLVGFLVDLLYAPLGFFWGVPMPATLLMFIVVCALYPWRTQLSVNH